MNSVLDSVLPHPKQTKEVLDEELLKNERYYRNPFSSLA